MVMRAILIATALWLVALPAGPALSQQSQPSKESLAAATDLLQALGTDKQFETMLPLMVNQIRTLILQANPAIAKEVDAMMPKLLERFAARKGDVIPLVARVYARRLSIEDMGAMATFLRTPAGKRFVETVPQLTQESMLIGQEWGRRLGEEIDREMREELGKRGIKL